MYLQQGSAVNEGDEFEFENHLVTVEESIGSTIQDLSSIMSPMIERRQVNSSREFLSLYRLTHNSENIFTHITNQRRRRYRCDQQLTRSCGL